MAEIYPFCVLAIRQKTNSEKLTENVLISPRMQRYPMPSISNGLERIRFVLLYAYIFDFLWLHTSREILSARHFDVDQLRHLILFSFSTSH